MKAEEKTFPEFIAGDITMLIPVYQRNYNWKRAHCERLFNDIKHIDETNQPHFIGTFVYKKESDGDIFKSYVIIDGQQRITSIILFARALYESVDDDLKSDINSKFLRHTSSGEMKNKFRLRPTEFDRSTFEKLMSCDFDENNFTADEKNTAMYKNYKFFREKIAESGIKPQEFFNAIHKLNIVSISLDGEKPQEIFESLNSTGLNLNQADLIRNFLLMGLEYTQQERLYKTYWLQMENLLPASDNVENFIIQYLIVKRKSNAVMKSQKQQLSKGNLYDTFKKYFSDNKLDAENCLRDMFRYANFFRRCTFNDAINFDNLPALDKKFYELTFLLKATNAPIILMYLLDRHEKKFLDEATFIKFVDALISLTFRAKICKRTGIDQQTAGNILSRLGNSLDENSFWRAITGGKGSYTFPNNEDFQTALTSNKLNESLKDTALLKYFLYTLEKNSPQKLPDYSDVVVECVMPTKLNNAWKKYLTERNDLNNAEQWATALGNLVLVDKKGTETFDKKKLRYVKSDFSYTQSVSGYSYWTSNQIQARTKKLSTAAIKIWILPEEFNIKIQNTSNLHYLDSDFKSLKNEKPATLSIAGTEIKMPYWNHLLREIVRQLYALDADTFRKATQMENIRKSLFTAAPTDFKIDDDFFMQTGFDTENCLKIAKALVENFDRIGETNFKEDIWFTIKH